MDAYEILRDACATLSDRGNTPLMRAKGDRALAALAELERAATVPVATPPPAPVAEMREPTVEECIAIAEECERIRQSQVGTLVQASVSAGLQREGRAMFAAVVKVMRPRG